MSTALVRAGEQSALTGVEQQELALLEAIIEREGGSFIRVGRALEAIRSRKLYRPHQTFEDYCRERWGFTQQHGTQLMRAADTVALLETETIVSVLPKCESQVRPLTRLRRELRVEAWIAAVEMAGGKTPTAAVVDQVVRGILTPELGEPLPLPATDKFSIILADPPWRYESGTTTPDRVIEKEYPTMTLEEICAVRVPEMADKNAVLFLWSTSPKLAEAMRVVEAWGFNYRTSFVWVKNRLGLGHYVRTNHELLLVAIRGKPGCPAYADRPRSVVEADKGRHSEKPSQFHDIIEKMYPVGRRIELFARQEREGWVAWGNEVEHCDGQDAREVPCGARTRQEDRDSLFALDEETRL